MEASPQDYRSQSLTVCNLTCRFAEPMRGDYSDWIWCTHPRAAVRLKNSASDCAWFEPTIGPGPERLKKS